MHNKIIFSVILLLSFLCLAFAQGNATTNSENATTTPEEKNFLNAVEAHRGRMLFTMDDIVRYDWNRQILELTPSASAIFSTIATEDITHYAFKDKDGIIYRGRIKYAPPAEGEVYDGAVMINDKTGNGKYPALPYLAIIGGYGVDPAVAEKADHHLNLRTKALLEENGLLDEILDEELPLEAVYSEWTPIDFRESEMVRFALYPNSYRAGSIGYVGFETNSVTPKELADSELENGYTYDRLKLYLKLKGEEYTSYTIPLAVISGQFIPDVNYVCEFEIKRGGILTYSNEHAFAHLQKFNRPAYPKDALNENRGGVITANVNIGLDGLVKKYEIIENTTDYDDLTKAAERAFLRLEFAPPTQEEMATVAITFLDGEVTHDLILNSVRPRDLELTSGTYDAELIIQITKGDGANAKEVKRINLKPIAIDVP